MPGMRISVIRHPVSSRWPDSKNSSADAKARAGKPTAFIRPCSALRTDSSSSTIATNFFSLRPDISARVAQLQTTAQLCLGIGDLILSYQKGRWLSLSFAWKEGEGQEG